MKRIFGTALTPAYRGGGGGGRRAAVGRSGAGRRSGAGGRSGGGDAGAWIRRPLALLVVIAALSGCAVVPGASLRGVADDAAAFELVARSVELTEVPFFPQTAYQCGPAALATLLAHEGVPVTADDLVPAVYVEGLRGSLQAELLAATRRHGYVPYRIDPDLDALFAEVDAGRPVLVMQNLGLPRVPVWHYAVVVGYDAERSRVVLRSGTDARREEKLKRFLRSWSRAERWAFVALAPDDIPADADADRWVRALNDAARLLPTETAADAFEAAATRWPTSAVAQFGAAVYAAEAGRRDSAAHRYGALLDIDPRHAAARNNLAHLLAEGGCFARARAEVQAALDLLEPGHALRPSIEATAAEIEALAAVRSDGNPRCP